MLEGLSLARGDGRYARVLKSLARVQVLILDDWGLTPLTAEQRRDLLEIVDDRHGRASTIVTSQLPGDDWHAHIGDPTLGHAILDRIDFASVTLGYGIFICSCRARQIWALAVVFSPR
jgi:DNA replication protein DnaC